MAEVDQKIPIKMLNDRLLVKISKEDGERTSSGGILIPATAQMAKRLVWAQVVALGQNVRSAEVGDKVLFSPDDRYEVEVQGEDYIMLRERDLHAVAAQRIEAQHRPLPVTIASSGQRRRGLRRRPERLVPGTCVRRRLVPCRPEFASTHPRSSSLPCSSTATGSSPRSRRTSTPVRC